ncbi:HD domain-containing protein [Geobacter sulfurreducens]|uniref:Cyclic diguanylate phosphodiesterase n=1 Tax=Geobacter sulfurreducens (strain ATCC 51573 / DSM 12127 / PCA) TaxID=243231 RepID=Q74D48_GEOSL|nr:HD domain-containing phosphohydrolase [Geobacter sulfurreducens]AAR34845.1 cyclic diguanylate phosphodiesterase [Geobacter sulfurreducens PCA]ADI84310.1 cyclic diguanylate phosphodiesterase [Geobacter sulfurreducens KN400]AJY71649.1 HD family phosphohydrolase [Geobacter sulfurreducens]QVW36649.1 HD domain-containing protein [Geobacter sulfurreducens]UAC05485.1 HD domain-containing protein [Geobacter sulfurreducens]
MTLELCRLSLQQTQELLRLTDATLKNICSRRFSGEELYSEAIRRVLGGGGKRGPESIFLLIDGIGGTSRGWIFQLQAGELVRSSDEILVDADSVYSLGRLGSEVLVSNWRESFESIERYQVIFHPDIVKHIAKPIRNFVACQISGESNGALLAFNYAGEATEYDGDVLRGLSVVIGSLVTLSVMVRETEHAFIYTIEALARACEAAEESTGDHIVRVNRYAGALAAHMDLSPDFVEVISYSAQMHDVGKIRVPTAILLKPGPLDEAEERVMRLHPEFGEQILGDSPRLSVAREIALSHHENWDGSGYPRGLQGEAIPLAGRIVKLADVYDALRSRRSYKKALSHAEARAVFLNGDERITPRSHFDPRVLETFFRIEPLFERIYQSSRNQQV